MLRVRSFIALALLFSCSDPVETSEVVQAVVPHAPSTSVGAIGGSFSVTPSGTAAYSVPLVLAPGRRGVEPSLSIDYDSSGRTGLLGVGWSLGGLSRIQRCEPRHDLENPIATIQWRPNDPLCLDGKPIVDGRLQPDDHTRIEAPALHAALGSFEVKTRNGLVWTYGGTTDTNVPGPGPRPGHAGDAIAEWWVRLVRDRFGNTMRFVYEHDGTTDHRISSIEYTYAVDPENSDHARAVLPARRRVVFVYGARDESEHIRRFEHGVETLLTKRLIRIENYVDDALVKAYELGYENPHGKPSGRTQLAEIRECDGAAVCKPPTRFEYSTTGITRWSRDWDTYPFSRNQHSNDAAQSPLVLHTDIDGRGDMVVKTRDTYRLFRGQDTSAASFAPEVLPFAPLDKGTLLRLDYDGDGRDDLVRVDPHQIILNLAGASQQFFNDETLATLLERTFQDVAVADFTGDGKDDILACVVQDVDPSCFNEEDKFEECEPEIGDCADPEDCEVECSDVAPQDCPHPDAYWHLLSGSSPLTDTGLECALNCGKLGCAARASWIVADFDHDGVDNLLQIYPMLQERPLDNSSPHLRIDTSYVGVKLECPGGNNCIQPELYDTELPPDVFQRYNSGKPSGRGLDRVFDVNGDGHADVVRFEPYEHDTGPPWDWTTRWDERFYRACKDDLTFYGARARVYLNTGTGFQPDGELMTFESYRDLCDVWAASVMVDWNGDGRGDLAYPKPDPLDSTAANLWVAVSRYPAIADVAMREAGEVSVPKTPLVAVDVAGTGMGLAYWHGSPASHEGSWHVLFRTETPDLLIRIVDGHGAETEIGYQPLSNEHVYTTGDTELKAIRDARPVVAKVVERIGNNDESWTQYRYHGLEVDPATQRSVGFTSRIAIAGAAGTDHTRIETIYAKHVVDEVTGLRPFVGQPAEERRWTNLAASGRQIVEQTEYTYATRHGTHLGPVLVTEAKHVRRWDLPGACNVLDGAGCVAIEDAGGSSESSSHTVEAWDRYGFPKTTVDDDGASTTIQTFVYQNDPGRWLIGLPSSITTTSNGGGQRLERTATYEYYPETGALHIARERHHDSHHLTTEYEYTRWGNVELVVSDPWDASHAQDTGEAKYAYDDEDLFPTRLTDANGRVTEIKWDRITSQPYVITDANKIAITTTRDGFGRATARRRGSPSIVSDGADHAITYERMDNPLSTTEPSRLRVRRVVAGGSDHTTEHDVAGRPIRTQWYGLDGEQRYQTTMYDARGRMAGQSLPAVLLAAPGSSSSLEYDEVGRLTKLQPAVGGATRFSYEGTTTTVTDPRDKVWTRVHDRSGRPKQVTDPYGTTLCFYTGAFGLPLGVGVNLGRCEFRPPANPPAATKDSYLITFEVDAAGHMLTLDDPNLGPRYYGYTGSGQLAWSETHVERTNYERDASGRLVRRVDSAGETRWFWDDDPLVPGSKYGFLRGTRSPDGIERTYQYDALTRLWGSTTTIDGETLSTSQFYDAFSRPSTTILPAAAGIPFALRTTYDAYGHVKSLRDAATNLPFWELTETTPGELLAEEVFGNGLVGRRSYDYGRLESLTTGTIAQPTAIQHVLLRYDPSGNLIERDDRQAGFLEGFEYDNVDRLFTTTISRWITPQTSSVVSGLSIDYNALGAIEWRSDLGTYEYGDRGAPLAVSKVKGVAYEYDDNHLLRARGETTFEYTPFFAPSSIEGPDGTETLRYDAEQQLIHRLEELADGTQKTTLFHGDYQRITEVDGPIATTRHEYLVRANGRTVARVRRSPGLGGLVTTTRYLHDDHLGSPAVATSEGGAEMERMSFDPWGRRRHPDLTQNGEYADPLEWNTGFTGVDPHRTGGVTWHGARSYDPAIGRFLAPDPLVGAASSTQGYDRFGYVRNRPLNAVDPSGMCSPPDCYNTEPIHRDIHVPAPEQVPIYDPGDWKVDYVPDDMVELEPVELSLTDQLGQAALGLGDAFADRTREVAPMGAAAVGGLLAPFVMGYLGYQSAQWYGDVVDNPGVLLDGILPIPEALATIDAIRDKDVRAAVRHGATFVAHSIEGFVGGDKAGGRRRPVRNVERRVEHADGSITYTKNGVDVTYVDGYGDFGPHLYKDGSNDVTIVMTGKRAKDADAANSAAGYTETPSGFTWHHHQDVRDLGNGSFEGRMQLVPTAIHQSFPHSGGAAVYRELTGRKYQRRRRLRARRSSRAHPRGCPGSTRRAW